MIIPPALVAGTFAVACLVSIAVIIYVAWRGSRPSTFFSEAVSETYEMDLPGFEIDQYYELKDKLQEQVETMVGGELVDRPDGTRAPWTHKLAPEEKLSLQHSLMRRLVKIIERLDKVQRDKPENWKLWRGKLVTEEYWNSLLEAEKVVGEEVDICLAEAEEVEPGWKEHIFQQAVQFWRMDKNQEIEKKEIKEAVKQEKKNVKKEEKAKVTEVKMAEVDKIRQEKAAEKAMEKLLREEEAAEKAEKKNKSKAPDSGKVKAKKK